MNDLSKKIVPYVTITSILISIVAVFISFRSCKNSSEALRLTQQEFEASRKLVLISIANVDNLSFKISTLDPDHRLQSVFVYFPEDIYERNRPLDAPEFIMELSDMSRRITEVLDSHITPPQTDSIKTVPVLFPTVIRSNYIARGTGRWVTSVYIFRFQYLKYRSSNYSSRLDFHMLQYVGEYTESQDIIEALNGYWNSHIEHLEERFNKEE